MDFKMNTKRLCHSLILAISTVIPLILSFAEETLPQTIKIMVNTL